MISIIVPVYNVEKYLPRCIESILAQTYKDFELILIDDGSPDRCPQICDEYAKNDDRVIVIHQKNAGVSAARNAGLRVAKGEYIGFVDSDDWVLPQMYEEMHNALKCYDAELVICGYNYYNESGDVDDSRIYNVQDNELLSQKELLLHFSDMPPTIRHGTVNKLFVGELALNCFFKESLHSAEDVLFISEYSKRVNKAVFVHKPLYCNLIRSGSATHGGLSAESLCDSISVHNSMYETIVSLYPDLKDHSLAFLLDVCLLKYNECVSKAEKMTVEEKQVINGRLREIKKYIKKMALQAIFDSEIYWKTRIMYLIF